MLALAIAFKGYPAALLIVPLGLRRYRFAILVGATAIVLNFSALLFFPGGLFENLKRLMPALTSLNLHNGTELLSWNIYSLVPKAVGLVAGAGVSSGLKQPDSKILWAFSALYLLGVWLIIARRRVPQWCWGPLALASVQVVVPLSYSYSTIWSVLGCVWFAKGELFKVADPQMAHRRTAVLRASVLLTLVVTTVPSALELVGVHGFETPLTAFLSPLFLTCTFGIAVFDSFQGSLVSDGVDERTPTDVALGA